MSADSDAQKGQDDYEVASTAWKEYRAASDEILQLSREGKQQEASKLMTGEVYEDLRNAHHVLDDLVESCYPGYPFANDDARGMSLHR